jgi:glucose uptake protein
MAGRAEAEAMFVVHDLGLAILFCVVTMAGWGSWPNTQKLADRHAWSFPLFYWDYAVGVFALGVLFALTLGSVGAAGQGVATNLAQAEPGPLANAFVSGALFNAANLLLVVAIDAAGMAVAVPVGVGLALVIGTVGSYVQAPRGDPLLLSAGVGAVLLAMGMSALAYSRLPRQPGGGVARGLLFAVGAGCLMGFFYPQLVRAISPEFQSQPIAPGMLTPYGALVLFGLGVVSSNAVVNTIAMRARGARYADYLRGRPRVHLFGFLGGCLWMLALAFNLLASGVAGPAASYALGQGATLVSAIWGVFVWREFRGAPAGTTPVIALMFASYVAGLTLIGLATR